MEDLKEILSNYLKIRKDDDKKQLEVEAKFDIANKKEFNKILQYYARKYSNKVTKVTKESIYDKSKRIIESDNAPNIHIQKRPIKDIPKIERQLYKIII